MNNPTIIGAPTGENAEPGKGGQPSAADEGGQGDLPEREWVKSLPEPLRAVKTLRKFKDESHLADLAKSYVELEGQFGKAVVLPDADAKPEEWEKFFSRVGRPQKPDEYESSAGKLDKAFEESFKARAFKAGLTKGQYKEALNEILEANENAKKAYSAQATREAAEATQALKTAFGKDFDAKMASANVAIGALFSDAVKAKIDSSGLRNDPEFMKSMATYGEQFGETQFVKGAPAAAGKKDPYDWMRERYGRP